ncbi:S1 domain-containing RNA-binding protein [Facklamia sp. P12955]|uniref:S1 domain-containing RNA-binding protein n=1 Tax=Facklamia sp. P12955 TaxID=3421946 RepID=UPI003D172FA4
MAVEVGQKVTGKVTGIKNFGAFVALDNNQSGLVHISEISDGFVNDINEVLSLGDEVTVKVVSVADDGKIGLSIRQAVDKPANSYQDKKNNDGSTAKYRKPKEATRRNFHQEYPKVPQGKGNSYPNQNVSGKYAQKNNDDFDQLMSNFLKDSEDRLISLKRNTEGKRGGRGGRRS